MSKQIWGDDFGSDPSWETYKTQRQWEARMASPSEQTEMENDDAADLDPLQIQIQMQADVIHYLDKCVTWAWGGMAVLGGIAFVLAIMLWRAKAGLP